MSKAAIANRTKQTTTINLPTIEAYRVSPYFAQVGGGGICVTLRAPTRELLLPAANWFRATMRNAAKPHYNISTYFRGETLPGECVCLTATSKEQLGPTVNQFPRQIRGLPAFISSTTTAAAGAGGTGNPAGGGAGTTGRKRATLATGQ